VQWGFFAAALATASLSILTAGLDAGTGLYLASSMIGIGAGSGVAAGFGAKPPEACAAGLCGAAAAATFVFCPIETSAVAGTVVSATTAHIVAEDFAQEYGKSGRNCGFCW